jgi:hypothetical protein
MRVEATEAQKLVERNASNSSLSYVELHSYLSSYTSLCDAVTRTSYLSRTYTRHAMHGSFMPQPVGMPTRSSEFVGSHLSMKTAVYACDGTII